VVPRRFDARRFEAVRTLNGEGVLLIDDTWTTGASAQSAAAALKAAGAGPVGAAVIGRHVNRNWHDNDRQLDALPFDWSQCGLCAPARLSRAA
jgi:orotate phosphoribosyltransferase